MSNAEPEQPQTPADKPPPIGMPELCVVCGSRELQEIRCKVVCKNCGTILMSCEDL